MTTALFQVLGWCAILVGMIAQSSAADPHEEHTTAQIVDERYDPLRCHHEQQVISFLQAKGFGAARLVLKVDGVHGALNGHHAGWQEGTIDVEEQFHDLIGLLRAPEPRVYTVAQRFAFDWTARNPNHGPKESARMLKRLTAASPALPAAKQDGIPVAERELDSFERLALQQLRAGHEMVKMEGEATMRAMGAIRAQATCLKCHDENKPGDLLGAFTYVFYKDSARGRTFHLAPAKLPQFRKLAAEGADASELWALGGWAFDPKHYSNHEEQMQALLTGLGATTKAEIEAQDSLRASLPMVSTPPSFPDDGWSIPWVPLSKKARTAGP